MNSGSVWFTNVSRRKSSAGVLSSIERLWRGKDKNYDPTVGLLCFQSFMKASLLFAPFFLLLLCFLLSCEGKETLFTGSKLVYWVLRRASLPSSGQRLDVPWTLSCCEDNLLSCTTFIIGFFVLWKYNWETATDGGNVWMLRQIPQYQSGATI